MALPPITVTPSSAAQAYARADAAADLTNADTGSFTTVLGNALSSVVSSGHDADAQAFAAISGHADVTSVVTAVSKAELALQTTVAIRDRVVQAYEDIMRMPI
jgi:flagellar hook-basal body complex protein FliE